MSEGASSREGPAADVAWESVLGGLVPPRPAKWIVNRMVDSLWVICWDVIFAVGFAGGVIPLVIGVTLPLFGGSASPFGMLPLVIALAGLPVGAVCGYFGWRMLRNRVPSTVGIGNDGLAAVYEKGFLRWVSFDGINSIDSLPKGKAGESMVSFDARKLGGSDGIIVNGEVLKALSAKLKDAGYEITPQGLVGKAVRSSTYP
jgi:hypothetical protein